MPVRVLELHFLLETGKVLTAWCGTEKPFANLFAHIMQMEALSKNTVFLYGGGRDTPDRGCVIGTNQTPSDLMIQGNEFIGIFELPASSIFTAALSAASSSSKGPGIQLFQRLRTPSRSPKRRRQQQLHLESKAEKAKYEEKAEESYEEAKYRTWAKYAETDAVKMEAEEAEYEEMDAEETEAKYEEMDAEMDAEETDAQENRK